MENKTIKLVRIIIVAIIALIALFFYIAIMRSDDNSGGIDGMLRFTYIVLGISILGAFLVWVLDIVKYPKKLIQFAISAGLFLIIILIAKYVLATKEAVHYYPNITVDAKTSNWIDTGLYTFYILGAIAILLMFLSPLLSMFAPNAAANAVGEIEEEIEEMVDDDE